MYLFTRRTRLAPGHGTAGVDWARSVAEKARALTGNELRLWGNAYSSGVGTIWWSGWFDGLDALERFVDQLESDPAMEKLTNAGTRYTAGGFARQVSLLRRFVPRSAFDKSLRKQLRLPA